MEMSSAFHARYGSCLFKNDELYRKNTELLRAEENLQNQKKETPKKSVLTDTNQIDALEARIEDILKNPEFLFSPDASLKSLAEKVSSNTSYVSFILNKKYSENFSILLGNLRVKVYFPDRLHPHDGPRPVRLYPPCLQPVTVFDEN